MLRSWGQYGLKWLLLRHRAVSLQGSRVQEWPLRQHRKPMCMGTIGANSSKFIEIWPFQIGCYRMCCPRQRPEMEAGPCLKEPSPGKYREVMTWGAPRDRTAVSGHGACSRAIRHRAASWDTVGCTQGHCGVQCQVLEPWLQVIVSWEQSIEPKKGFLALRLNVWEKKKKTQCLGNGRQFSSSEHWLPLQRNGV